MKISSSPNQIGIVFKVWAPQLTRVTKKLFLLGSLKELGAWNIDKALKASPTMDMHVWTVEVSLPAMSHFEWVWLTTNMNRGDVQWEKTSKRNRSVDCFSGTLHTIWGINEEVFLQTATCLEVTTYIRVEDGFTLVLTGSTPSTGEWNLHYAKPAREFPKRSGYWKVQVAFDALSFLEFKWAIVKENDLGVVRVQEKLPHAIFGRMSWMRVVAPWMTHLAIVVDTPLLCELPDTKQGRTDIIVQERKKRIEEINAWLSQAESNKTSAVDKKSTTKPLSGAFEKPDSMASFSLQAHQPRLSTATTPTSTFSDTDLMATLKASTLEEYTHEKDLSQTEKQTKQLYMKFREEKPIHVIKGIGQKEVPIDKMNIGDLSAEATEWLPKVYGDVAEITLPHVLACYTQPKQRTKCLLLDRRESQGGGTLEKQHQERSLIKMLGDEDTPMAQEGEIVGVKGNFLPDNEINEEDCEVPAVIHEVTPLCVKSQTVPDTACSDTGFTEMSSLMSSVRTEETTSESALTSSHTMTCVLAADVNNVSDGDDSPSEVLVLKPAGADKVGDGVLSYWESQQPDLSPPWLDQARAYVQGHSDFLGVEIPAVLNDDDDFQHLEWLVSRMKEEGSYPDKAIRADSVYDDQIFTGDGNIQPGVGFEIDGTKWISSSPPRSLPVNCSPLKFTYFDETEQKLTYLDETEQKLTYLDETEQKLTYFDETEQKLLNDAREKRSPCFGEFDYLYENDLTPYGSINVDSESEELTQRRLLARALEEQWGNSFKEELWRNTYKASEDPQLKAIPQPVLPPRTIWKDQDSLLTAFAEGIQDLLSSERKTYRVAYYSCSELSDMLFPETDFVSSREKAREMERLWGESQMTSSWMSGEADTTISMIPKENLLCTGVSV